MNPRDFDAFYDAIIGYAGAKARENRSRTWQLKNFARELPGKWKLNQDDDVRYADERAWVRDIFKPETTCWTEERDRYPGFAPRRNGFARSEELQAGDTAQLDSFLASFTK